MLEATSGHLLPIDGTVFRAEQHAAAVRLALNPLADTCYAARQQQGSTCAYHGIDLLSGTMLSVRHRGQVRDRCTSTAKTMLMLSFMPLRSDNAGGRV